MISRLDVAWVCYDHDAINRGYWDQGLLERLFAGQVWTPVGWPEEFVHTDSFEGLPIGKGAVVVLPARYHVLDTEKLNYQLAQLPWVLLLLTSDEESLFPWRELSHPKMKMWCMTPRTTLHADFPGRFLGEYFKQECPDVLGSLGYEGRVRTFDWYFSGQVTHKRRTQCVEAVRDIPNGFLNETPGFTQGFDYPEYLKYMVSSKIALAPSGPGTPDSFRLYEALEAGCVPIVDASSPGGPEGYWDLALPGHPFPVVQDWQEVGPVMEEILKDWTVRSNECSAWWQSYKRDLAYALVDDVKELMYK